jgi:hypothetical protein
MSEDAGGVRGCWDLWVAEGMLLHQFPIPDSFYMTKSSNLEYGLLRGIQSPIGQTSAYVAQRCAVV